MITLVSIAVPFALLGALDALSLKFGAESRHQFSERRPI